MWDIDIESVRSEVCLWESDDVERSVLFVLTVTLVP